jgi:hypothetical protein
MSGDERLAELLAVEDAVLVSPWAEVELGFAVGEVEDDALPGEGLVAQRGSAAITVACLVWRCVRRRGGLRRGW